VILKGLEHEAFRKPEASIGQPDQDEIPRQVPCPHRHIDEGNDYEGKDGWVREVWLARVHGQPLHDACCSLRIEVRTSSWMKAKSEVVGNKGDAREHQQEIAADDGAHCWRTVLLHDHFS